MRLARLLTLILIILCCAPPGCRTERKTHKVILEGPEKKTEVKVESEREKKDDDR